MPLGNAGQRVEKTAKKGSQKNFETDEKSTSSENSGRTVSSSLFSFDSILLEVLDDLLIEKSGWHG